MLTFHKNKTEPESIFNISANNNKAYIVLTALLKLRLYHLELLLKLCQILKFNFEIVSKTNESVTFRVETSCAGMINICSLCFPKNN